jgi:soluble lytic murein transglycosylase-like protein
MIPEARPSFRFILALALTGVSVACACGQERNAFSLTQDSLADALAKNDVAALLSLSEAELGGTGAFGPTAYYYLARRLEALSSEKGARIAKAENGKNSSSATATAAAAAAAATARRLYRRAYDGCSGLARREAGLALLRNLDAAGLWNELLAFSCAYEKDIGPDWNLYRLRLGAADALGLYDDAAALVEHVAAAYPEEAAKDAEALACYSALASLRSGQAGGSEKPWRPSFRRLLLESPFSDWSARAFALLRYEASLGASFSEKELHAIAMRDAVRRRDFGAAHREAGLASDAALSPSSSKAMVADAGKAFLYSGSSKEGEALFGALEAAAAKGPDALSDGGGIAWTALFYRARFARALERWTVATALFKQAAAWGPTKTDADSCLWYAVDSSYQESLAAQAQVTGSGPKAAAESSTRAVLLEALAAASASWSDAEEFSDFIDVLLGEALRARDFVLVESMAERLGGKLGPETGARVAYAAARIFELGLGTTPVAGQESSTTIAGPGSRAAIAVARFAAIANQSSAPLYYRALAAWRAGIEPTLAPSEVETSGMEADAVRGELETFLDGMASFGLVDPALSEARAREVELDDAALRRLALRFSSSGRPDCAIRLALDLSSRPAYRPRRADYELLYPRPYLDLIVSLPPEAGLTEELAFGLIRSESLFRADVESGAGAIGLAQLMPATAAAQAKALGLKSYDLKEPRDNLAIGLAHFASLLRMTGQKPLRAMMAYNAGWGRYRSGIVGTEGLPDDLVVEAFALKETRQYCRKILPAAVMYDALYYEKNLGKAIGALVKSD